MTTIISYTASTPILCSNPVAVGGEKIWKETITPSGSLATHVIVSSKTNTYWSLDNATWYNSTDGEVALGVAKTAPFSLWIKFVPAFVDDVPGTVAIKEPAVP
jgi:hypothetical protein